MVKKLFDKLTSTKKSKVKKVTSKIDDIVVDETTEQIWDILAEAWFISTNLRQKITDTYELVHKVLNEESKRVSTYWDMAISICGKNIEDLIKVLKESWVDLRIWEMLVDEWKINAIEYKRAVVTFVERQKENRWLSFWEVLLLNESLPISDFVQFLKNRKIRLKLLEFWFSIKEITEEQILTCLQEQQVGENFEKTLLRLYWDILDLKKLRLVDETWDSEWYIKPAEFEEMTEEQKAEEFAIFIDDDTDDDTTQFKITSTKNDTFDDTDDDTITIMGVTNDKFSVKPKNLNKKSPKTK